MKKVGIIIPYYNAAKYIEESIQSCFDQDYDNIQVIVVVDKSEEELVYADWMGKKILSNELVICGNKVNVGASESRNIGARAATGLGCDYLLFHDADDTMTKNSIVDRIDIIKEPFVSVVYGDYYNMTDEGKVVSYENKPDFSFSRLLEDNYISCLSLTKTLLFNAVGGFDRHLTFNEDGDLWLRLVRFGLAVHVHKPVFNYRMNPNSQTRTIDWEIYNIDRLITQEKQRMFSGEIIPEQLMSLYNRKIQLVAKGVTL